MKLSVSYLKNKKGIEETLQELEKSSCDYIHMDLMDGIFAGVKNYEIDNVLSLFHYTKKPLDIHLMVKNPDEEIESLAILNPKYITVHIELPNVKKYISKIKGLGIQAGVAVNPETKVNELEPFLDNIDLVLVMSVNPGKGGQEFLPTTIEKLTYLYELRNKKNLNFAISVDGGINDQTKQFVKSYANILVSGSYICMTDNIEKQINTLRKD